MISGRRRGSKRAVAAPSAAGPADRTLWVAFTALAVFGGSLFTAFHFDDYGMLQDPAIVSPGGWVRCWSLLQTRPLTWFTFWLNYQISGREPMLWHAVNLALHAGCAAILYRVLRRVLADAGPGVALAGALIFALHPIEAESVDYVYTRATLLCALFSLLAIDAWIPERKTGESKMCERKPGESKTGERNWLSVAWFTLAVLSKEECVTVPLVLFLWGGVWRQPFRRILPILTMLGISLAAGIRVIAAIHVTGMKNIGVNAGISPLGYFSEQGIAILRYFGLLVFPWGFSVDPEIPSPEWWWRVLAWMVLGALIAAAAVRFRQAPVRPTNSTWPTNTGFWILAGFLLLIPSSSIFPAADLAADRRMYLPMMAFAPAIALLLPARRIEWPLIIAGLLAALSMERTYVWASDERLWGEAVQQAPEKIRPKIQLSRAVAPARAMEILREAERMAPQNPDVPTELARVYLELDRNGEALGEAGRALALEPHEPHAINNRGAVLLAMNQTEAARDDFLAALRIDPCLAEARENLERSGGIPADAPRCPTTP